MTQTKSWCITVLASEREVTNDGDHEYLRSLIKQRTIQAQVVIRAHILLDKANGIPIRDIVRIYDLSTNTVRLCIDKYKEGGTDRALFDDQRKGRPVEITDDAVAWMTGIACQRPADLGYPHSALPDQPFPDLYFPAHYIYK